MTDNEMLLFQLVEILLSEVVEHVHHGNAAAMYDGLSLEGRHVLDRLVKVRLGATL